MKKRIVTKIGDIFAVKVSKTTKKFLQLVASDLTQLNCDVVRAFEKEFSVEAEPTVNEIVSGKVDFYAHCVTKLGVKLGYWEKTGKSEEIGDVSNILFRDTEDYAKKEYVRISQNWYVWRIGDPDFTMVGKLEGENRNAEIGLVINPASIVHRLQTGEYDMPFYPGFD